MNYWHPISSSFKQEPLLQYLGIGIASLLIILLLWRAYQRANQRFLVIRLSANLLAVIALLMIFLQPLKKVQIPNRTAIIATANAPLDSLVENANGKPVFVLSKDYSKAFFAEEAPIAIPHISILKDKYPDIQHLQLFGVGLPLSDLSYLDSFHIDKFQSATNGGILELKQPYEIEMGRPFQISGKYLSKRPSQKLELIGPNGKEELLMAKEEGLYNLEKVLQINQAGRYRYSLLENEKDTLGHFGVHVTAPSSIQSLIINNAPNFETKYLKNWLVDQGFAVAMRSSISKDKFKTDFYNQSSYPLSRLNTATLRPIDFLFISTSALMQMDKAERNTLHNAVNEGLGVCVWMDMPIDDIPSSIQRRWLAFSMKKGTPEISLPINKDFFILQRQAVDIPPSLGTITLAEANGKIFAATKPILFGQKALLLIQNSYLLQLDGQEETYHKIWKNILEKVARKKLNNTQWSLPKERPILIHQPLKLRFLSSTPSPKVFIQNGNATYEIPAMQYPFDEERWELNFIPKEEGWHQAYLEGESSFPFYVSGEKEWLDRRQAAVIKANSYHFSALKEQRLAKKENEQSYITSKEAFPTWPFFLVFLVSMITLWIEEKL